MGKRTFGWAAAQPHKRNVWRRNTLIQRGISLILAIGIVAAMVSPAALAEGNALSGSGTEEDPYLIADADDLKAISNTSSQDYYKLTANIDLQNEDWTPLPAFYGTLDGDGYTISGLNINSDDMLVGLFRELRTFGSTGGVIKNLTVSGAVVNTHQGYGRTGGIVSQNYGTITNCTFSGSISHSAGDNNAVGGITGINNGAITNCTNKATIKAQGKYELYVGGITGSNHGEIAIDSCSNYGELSGVLTGSETVYYGVLFGSASWQTRGGYVGGIAGDTGGEDSITNCTNQGSVSVTTPGGTQTAGDSPAATHNHAMSADCSTTTGEQLAFTPWEQTDALPATAGSYYLTQDVTLTESWQMSDVVDLCLNGHTIQLDAGANDSVIKISGIDSVLNLCDCSTAAAGKITGGNASVAGGGIYLSGIDTELNLYGGVITGNKTQDNYHGGGVDVSHLGASTCMAALSPAIPLVITVVPATAAAYMWAASFICTAAPSPTTLPADSAAASA